MARHIEVVGAVLIREGTVLCVQRRATGPLPGMWEFPGGKVEPGESPATALVREIREELTCVVSVGHPLTATTYEYPFATVRLITYYCDIVHGEPTLTEHAAMMWAHPAQLAHLNWAAADLPTVELVQTALTGSK